ncbi:MAG TPA: DUF998 domain-containing protein [Pyrinomonadaceae bacterium]|nr:DUF998 domain-containing protein [Pyrinomonadaceae bacterium]
MENTSTKEVSSSTSSLLACGIAAGPIYIAVGILQIIIRPGFDVTRHALSLMSNGDLGWIQISNFLLTGLLTIAFAVGIRQLLKGQKGGTWGALLIGVYGLGLIGAGIFKADPALGFPPGTPVDAHAISTNGLMHFVCGGIGFYAIIAACFVFARRFSSLGLAGWKWYSFITGVLFFAAFFGIASGSGGSGPTRTFVTLGFYAAVVIIWVWLSALAFKLRADV